MENKSEIKVFGTKMGICETKTPQNEQARPAMATDWWIVGPNGSENGQKPNRKNLVFNPLLYSRVTPRTDPLGLPREPCSKGRSVLGNLRRQPGRRPGRPVGSGYRYAGWGMEGERGERGERLATLAGVCRRQGSAEGQRKSGSSHSIPWRDPSWKSYLVDLLGNLEGD